jgi:hypothetical protein
MQPALSAQMRAKTRSLDQSEPISSSTSDRTGAVSSLSNDYSAVLINAFAEIRQRPAGRGQQNQVLLSSSWHLAHVR